MVLVDDDKLFWIVQGFGSLDYDFYYYDEFGGFLKNDDVSDKDLIILYVVVYYFWVELEEKRS